MQEIYERLPLILNGLGVTVSVALLSLAVALSLGLLGAAANLSKHAFLRAIGVTYTSLVRGIPELVLLLIMFYGVQMLLNRVMEGLGLDIVSLDAFTIGVLVIGFIYGAYMAESFRGAWLSIPKGQIEAGQAIGMSPMILMRRIIWPQLMRYALPGIGNNWQVLLKATALISIVGLQDVVWVATSQGRSTQMPFTFMVLVLLLYLGLNELSRQVIRYAEKRFSIGQVSFDKAQGM